MAMLHGRGAVAESRAEHLQLLPPHSFADILTLRHRSDHFPASRLLNVNVQRSSTATGDCTAGATEWLVLVLDSRDSGRRAVGADCNTSREVQDDSDLKFELGASSVRQPHFVRTVHSSRSSGSASESEFCIPVGMLGRRAAHVNVVD